MGVDLEQHIQFVIDAMRRVAGAIGLAGTPISPPITAAPAAEEPAR
jgi:hypothetical protein